MIRMLQSVPWDSKPSAALLQHLSVCSEAHCCRCCARLQGCQRPLAAAHFEHLSHDVADVSMLYRGLFGADGCQMYLCTPLRSEIYLPEYLVSR